VSFSAESKYGEGKNTEIDSDFDRLTFEYSSTLFHQLQTIEYACQLEGFDATWSSWTKKTSKEYTQLPAGTYLFKVKARNNLGQESDIASYQIIFTSLVFDYLGLYFLSFVAVSCLLEIVSLATTEIY
jgi:hypothetical protein